MKEIAPLWPLYIMMQIEYIAAIPARALGAPDGIRRKGERKSKRRYEPRNTIPPSNLNDETYRSAR